ncbi:MAG: hypothetical protein JST21_11555 [Bacteroidetes bacterium]|nr:hypothetical protein [Bacteroidota bacterium]
MGRLIFIFILFFFWHTVTAQTETVQDVKEKLFVQGSYTDFYVDNLNNIYLLNAGNQIKKLNDKGDSVTVSNAQKIWGDIGSIDVSNSLKIVVYYKDFSTIIVLDRFLKNVHTIDLRKCGILQAEAVATSYDNNYWVFDEVENKLKKVDDNGNILLSTPDLRTVFDEPYLPEKIIDYNGNVYLYNKRQGFKIFDYYGALLQSLPLINWNDIEVEKNIVSGFINDTLHVYNNNVFTEKVFLFNPPQNDATRLYHQLNNLYVLKNDGLHVFNILQ